MKIKIALLFIALITSIAIVFALSNQESIGIQKAAKQKPVIQYKELATIKKPVEEQKLQGNTLMYSNLSRPPVTWAKVYGNGEERLKSIQQTRDGGYIVAGSTGAWPDVDILLVKIDGNGNKQWEKTFDGGDADSAYSVRQTLAGKYVVTGKTYTDENGDDVWLIKTDENGNQVWAKTFGGFSEDVGESVQQLADAYGSYIVAGFTKSFGEGGNDIYLIKMDADGNLLWEKDIGGSGMDTAHSVLTTSDGGYIVLADTEYFGAGGYDIWLLKRDSNGNRLWEKTFGTAGNDFGNSIEKTNDGGYIISGSTIGFNDRGLEIDGIPWLIKTDSEGNKEWNRTYEGRYETYAKQTSDGGYIIATSTPADRYEGWGAFKLIKTDAIGNQQWYSIIGGPEIEDAISVLQTNDGGYIIAGDTGSCGGRSKILVVKTDAEGKVYAEPDCASIGIQEPR